MHAGAVRDRAQCRPMVDAVDGVVGERRLRGAPGTYRVRDVALHETSHDHGSVLIGRIVVPDQQQFRAGADQTAAGAAKSRTEHLPGRERAPPVGAHRYHDVVAVVVPVPRIAERAVSIFRRIARRGASPERLHPDAAGGIDGQLAPVVGGAGLRSEDERVGIRRPSGSPVRAPPLEIDVARRVERRVRDDGRRVERLHHRQIGADRSYVGSVPVGRGRIDAGVERPGLCVVVAAVPGEAALRWRTRAVAL